MIVKVGRKTVSEDQSVLLYEMRNVASRERKVKRNTRSILYDTLATLCLPLKIYLFSLSFLFAFSFSSKIR